MQESVQGGGSHDAVTSEDMTPVAEGFVGGDDGGGLFFITLADDLEEQRSLVVIEAELADLIDDEQLGCG